MRGLAEFERKNHTLLIDAEIAEITLAENDVAVDAAPAAQKQWSRCGAVLARAREQGATVALGGGRPAEQARA